jgi:hypothetical protein
MGTGIRHRFDVAAVGNKSKVVQLLLSRTDVDPEGSIGNSNYSYKEGT